MKMLQVKIEDYYDLCLEEGKQLKNLLGQFG